jgi:hypothetical protein
VWAERRPVGVRNASRSLLMTDEGDEEPFIEDVGVVYRSDVIASGGGESPAGQALGVDAAPGRAPHAWVLLDGRRVSILDLFDGG